MTFLIYFLSVAKDMAEDDLEMQDPANLFENSLRRALLQVFPEKLKSSCV